MHLEEYLLYFIQKVSGYYRQEVFQVMLTVLPEMEFLYTSTGILLFFTEEYTIFSWFHRNNWQQTFSL